MHGELAILCKRHMHNYGLAVYSVCGHACSSHWSHTSPLHDRTKTANGSCSSENPPRNSGMRPGLTVRRSTSDSTLSRPTVAFFPLQASKKSHHTNISIYIIYTVCSAALHASHLYCSSLFSMAHPQDSADGFAPPRWVPQLHAACQLRTMLSVRLS